MPIYELLRDFPKIIRGKGVRNMRVGRTFLIYPFINVLL